MHIRIIHIYGIYIVYVYVIARVGVKFGINFMLFATQPNSSELCLEISQLIVLLKINTIASLLFILNVLVLCSQMKMA